MKTLLQSLGGGIGEHFGFLRKAVSWRWRSEVKAIFFSSWLH
jgi:hypothetical protein